MSRLHDLRVGGLDNTELMPNQQTANIRTYGDKLQATLGADSPRKGTRRTRTMAKTARACGSNYTPTFFWGDRHLGEAGNAYKHSNRRAQTAQAKKFKREGISAMKG